MCPYNLVFTKVLTFALVTVAVVVDNAGNGKLKLCLKAKVIITAVDCWVTCSGCIQAYSVLNLCSSWTLKNGY